jgi:hypothetical protein
VIITLLIAISARRLGHLVPLVVYSLFKWRLGRRRTWRRRPTLVVDGWMVWRLSFIARYKPTDSGLPFRSNCKIYKCMPGKICKLWVWLKLGYWEFITFSKCYLSTLPCECLTDERARRDSFNRKALGHETRFATGWHRGRISNVQFTVQG